MRLRKQTRSGATVVESAVVYPMVMLLLLGLVVGGTGMLRYQEMASLAREGARWASVHGKQYAADHNKSAATAVDIYEAAIKPNVAALDLEKLTYAVSWNTDNAPYHTIIENGDVVGIQNTVTVTVSYAWIPEAFLGGITLTSTSVMPMSY